MLGVSLILALIRRTSRTILDTVVSLGVRHPLLVCALWLICALVVGLTAPHWDTHAQDDDIHSLPATTPSVRGYQLLEQGFPQEVFASRVLFVLERDRPLTSKDLALADMVVQAIQRLSVQEPTLQIKKVYSHRDPLIGQRLLSNDKSCLLIQVSLGTPYLAVQTRETVDRIDQQARACLAPFADSADIPAFYITGPAGVGRDLIAAGADSLERTTLATFLLVIVILLLVYRAPILALVPLVTIATAVYVALNLLALATLIPGFRLANVSQIFAVVMLYGAGTDYCLFLISRYREELASGLGRDLALVSSLRGVAGALVASAATVVVGLGMMGQAEFAKIRSGGPAIGVSLVVALLASLTLTPALLRLLGRVAFWPLGRGTSCRTSAMLRPGVRLHTSSSADPEGLWGRISSLILARPALFWCLALALLLPLAFLGLRVQPTYRAISELSDHSSSVQGLAAIQRHFTSGEVGPTTVLLSSNSDWNTRDGRRVIEHLSAGLRGLPNIAEVRSLTRPLGQEILLPIQNSESVNTSTTSPTLRSAEVKPLSLLTQWVRKTVNRWEDQVRTTAEAFYCSQPSESTGEHKKYITRLDVVFQTDPFDPRSLPTLDLIESWLRSELPHNANNVNKINNINNINSGQNLGLTQAEVYGATVGARDLASVTERDRNRVNWLVVAAIFFILLVVVRRPGLAAYLLATVLLSYLATLGATTLFAHYTVGRPLGEVDWRVPFFLFTILVAIGEDYNILLITRTLEERQKYGGREGTRRALARTGGTITACGLIMAGTFATLMLAGLNTLVQIGFALAFGVLLDTFVVRTLLVPTFTHFLWREEQVASCSTKQTLRPQETLMRAA